MQGVNKNSRLLRRVGTLALAVLLSGCSGKDDSPSGEKATDGDPEVTLTAYEVQVPLGLPELTIPEDNPMSVEKIELGKMLYFDTRLSKDGTISCATCHDPSMGWAEETPTSTGIGDEVGGANSPSVANSAYGKAQFWDGRAATLEEQALGPIENPIEMGHNLDELVPELNEIEGYKEQFQTVFGTDVTKDGIAKAIAAFERTILCGNSPYDQFNAGDESALTDVQKKGMQLFKDLKCSTCHSGKMFSGYGYYNAGIGSDKETPDQGRMAVTKDEKDLGKYRVPSLRSVADTGPYFHDGSCATLEEAVKIMATGGIANDNLSSILAKIGEKNVSAEDQAALVEFLKALSGEMPSVDPPTLPESRMAGDRVVWESIRRSASQGLGRTGCCTVRQIFLPQVCLPVLFCRYIEIRAFLAEKWMAEKFDATTLWKAAYSCTKATARKFLSQRRSHLMTQPIESPAAWSGEELLDRADWHRTLGSPELSDLYTALSEQETEGDSQPEGEPRLLPLGQLAETVAQLSTTWSTVVARVWCRACALRAFPRELCERCFGVSPRAYGTPVSQSARGERIFSVRDEGYQVGQPQNARAQHSQTIELPYGPLRCDCLSLFAASQIRR